MVAEVGPASLKVPNAPAVSRRDILMDGSSNRDVDIPISHPPGARPTFIKAHTRSWMFFVVCCDHPTFARGQIFRGLETERADIAERTDFFRLVFCAVCLRAVLNNREVVALGNFL